MIPTTIVATAKTTIWLSGSANSMKSTRAISKRAEHDAEDDPEDAADQRA